MKKFVEIHRLTPILTLDSRVRVTLGSREGVVGLDRV